MLSCTHQGMPKPYGYYRIATPDTAYIWFSESPDTHIRYPYQFALSRNAEVREHARPGDKYWIDIHYPTMNMDIHCSYKPVSGNLRELSDDAIEFVYKHASHASAIPERDFSNPDAHVYGVLFTLEGNTASPYQFVLTDSVRHFFRGSVYCNCRPNADSLAPVHDYIEKDVIRLVETFTWNE